MPGCSLQGISQPKGCYGDDCFQVIVRLFVDIGVPLSLKNVPECRSKGTDALEYSPRDYNREFGTMKAPFDSDSLVDVMVEVVELDTE